MQAVGTAAAPIRFAAMDPAVPWKGLRFENTQPGSNFTYCMIEDASSSGMTLINASALVIDHCTFTSNSNTGGTGGAINANGVTGNLQLQNCTFSGNTAASNGGALWVKMSQGFALSIADSLFDHNTANPAQAIGNYGAGALWLESGDCVISRSRFVANRSNSHCAGFRCRVTAGGGAIYLVSTGSVTIENSEFTENQSDALNNQGNCQSGSRSISRGAAVQSDTGTVTLSNNILSCNMTTASMGSCGPVTDGGGLYVTGGSVTAINNTIARNPDATGVAADGGTLNIVNSILYFNNGNQAQVGGTATITITYSDVQGGFTGEGNINFSPVFAGTGCAVDDLKLVLGSPAIDTGNPDPAYSDACFPPSLPTARNDMGAFGGPGACNFTSTGEGGE